MARSLLPHSKRQGALSPFLSLREEMDHLFDDWAEGLNIRVPSVWKEEGGNGLYNPRIDMVENEKAIKVTAELPGINDKDLEITVSDDSITIRGEKSEEKETKENNYHCHERRYGSFERTLPLPSEVDSNKASAEFKKGILQITLPKTQREQKKRHKLSVKTE